MPTLFTRFKNWLDRHNYPDINEIRRRLIEGVPFDLTAEEQRGNIDWRDDGVYMKVGDIWYKGYMYLKRKRTYQGSFKLPKFHIRKFQTIVGEEANGNFSYKYFWSRHRTVTITQMPENIVHENRTLQLCGYCRPNVFDNFNTEDFFNSLDGIEILEEEIVTDRFGYPLKPINWNYVSSNYRRQVKYTCENSECGIKIKPGQKTFLHVHHIDGNKLNCNTQNLKALCVLCHANVDEHHETNFNTNEMQETINDYISKYREELEALGNPYIT